MNDGQHASGILTTRGHGVGDQQETNDFSGGLIAARIVKGVHALIVNTVGSIRVHVGLDEGRDEQCRWISCACGVNGKKAPHDFAFLLQLVVVIFVFFILARILFKSENGLIPIAVANGFVERGYDILVVSTCSSDGLSLRLSSMYASVCQSTLRIFTLVLMHALLCALLLFESLRLCVPANYNTSTATAN
jgi:hypothetical protein